MATRTASRALTYRDLEHTPEDGRRYEVIDGVLYVSPFPTYPHQRAAGYLFGRLFAHVNELGLGEVLPAGLMVVLGDPTGVGPDIVFIGKERMARMRREGYHGPPDLVVEVLSSKPKLDRVIKMGAYAAAGIPHYWIVDPNRQTLEAYRLEPEGYEIAAKRTGSERFEPELFPGLTLDLSEIWVS